MVLRTILSKYIGWSVDFIHDLFWWLKTEKDLGPAHKNFFVCNHHMGDTFIFCSYLSKFNKINRKNYSVIVPRNYSSIPEMFSLDYVLFSSLPKNRGLNDIYYILCKVFRFKTLPSVCGYIDAIKLGGKNKVDLYSGPTAFLGMRIDESPDLPFNFNKKAMDDVKKLVESTKDMTKKAVLVAPYAKTLHEIPTIFWSNLIQRLFEKGYIVYVNTMKNETEFIHAIPVSLPPDELFLFAKSIGRVISLRSGLCDLLLPANIQLTIVYSEDFTKEEMVDIFIDKRIEEMFKTKLSQIILKNHGEFDYINAIELILKSVESY